MSTGQRRLDTILGHLKASSAAGGDVKYRYSMDGESAGVLTREERQHYEDNGFLVVKGLVPLHDIDTYRERFRKICTKEVEVIDLSTMPLYCDFSSCNAHNYYRYLV